MVQILLFLALLHHWFVSEHSSWDKIFQCYEPMQLDGIGIYSFSAHATNLPKKDLFGKSGMRISLSETDKEYFLTFYNRSIPGV